MLPNRLHRLQCAKSKWERILTRIKNETNKHKRGRGVDNVTGRRERSSRDGGRRRGRQ